MLDYKLRLGTGLESDLIVESIVLREFEKFVTDKNSDGVLGRLSVDDDDDGNEDEAEVLGSKLIRKSREFATLNEFTDAKRLRECFYKKQELRRRLIRLLPE